MNVSLNQYRKQTIHWCCFCPSCFLTEFNPFNIKETWSCLDECTFGTGGGATSIKHIAQRNNSPLLPQNDHPPTSLSTDMLWTLKDNAFEVSWITAVQRSWCNCIALLYYGTGTVLPDCSGQLRSSILNGATLPVRCPLNHYLWSTTPANKCILLGEPRAFYSRICVPNLDRGKSMLKYFVFLACSLSQPSQFFMLDWSTKYAKVKTGEDKLTHLPISTRMCFSCFQSTFLFSQILLHQRFAI